MSIIYDKPFMTYSQLISLMESRNIIVKDKASAAHVLRNLSYYTLVNGYKNSFLYSPTTDSFVEGTTFEELYTLHMIDTSLSNIVLKNILLIEKGLKSRISYLISEKYGVFSDYSSYAHSSSEDYLCRNNYGHSSKRNTTIKKLTDVLSGKATTFQSESIQHYRNNHNHIPPWILSTSIGFGDTILWYDILKPDDKQAICDQFIADNQLNTLEKKEFLKKSLDLLRHYRNTIAHEGRTLSAVTNIQLPKKSTLLLSHGIILESEYNTSPFAKSGLHAVFVPLAVLLNDRYFFRNLIMDLLNVIGRYVESNATINGKTIPELFNIPTDICDRLNNYYK